MVSLDLTINIGFYNIETLTECDSLTWAVNGTINGTTWSTDAPALTTNNCTVFINVDLTINPLPSIDLGADTTLICDGTSETIDAGTKSF